MSPVTHLLISWGAAHAVPMSTRDRILVTLAGVLPDVDAFGLVIDLAARLTGKSLHLWDRFHHVFGHNLLFALLLGAGVWTLAKKRAAAGVTAIAVVHLHLLCDLVGARGPDGYQWPIPYLWPFSSTPELTWSGQWALNAWPNMVITLAVLALALVIAVHRGVTPLIMLSARADRAVVAALRRRFGRDPDAPLPGDAP